MGIILLHGLRQSEYPDLFTPLEPLLRDLAAYIPQQNFFRYEWHKDLNVDPIRLALRGTLGIRAAPHFHQRFLEYQGKHPEISRWIVGGYSAGAWIFYQWLADWPLNGELVRPLQSQRGNIILAFTIGAPWQNIHDEIYFGDDPRPILVRKWQLDAETLATALRPGILHVIFSTADTTTWPDNARFPDGAIQSGLVNQHPPLIGVPHKDLCQNQQVRDYIKTSVAALI